MCDAYMRNVSIAELIIYKLRLHSEYTRPIRAHTVALIFCRQMLMLFCISVSAAWLISGNDSMHANPADAAQAQSIGNIIKQTI